MKKKKKQPQPESSKSLGFIKDLAYALVAVLIINSFLLASFEVPTSSMEDTVKAGDRLFVNKFIYGGTTPYAIPLTSIRIPHIRVPGLRGVRRGDVIVFDWPGPRDQVSKPAQTWYLKRCIALPGDTLSIEQHVVSVNGKVVPNPKHAKFMRPSLPADMSVDGIFPRGARFNPDNYGPIVIPKKGMVLDLNPENFPAWQVFIEREGHRAEMRGDGIYIDGSRVSRYVVARDYIFAMGDNRDNSLDSRFWGFVPLEDVIGKPMLVYWSWDPDIGIINFFSKIASVRPGRIGTIIR
jgi:signal peptidase I